MAASLRSPAMTAAVPPPAPAAAPIAAPFLPPITAPRIVPMTALAPIFEEASLEGDSPSRKIVSVWIGRCSRLASVSVSNRTPMRARSRILPPRSTSVTVPVSSAPAGMTV
jgi:hypothetical protein